MNQPIKSLKEAPLVDAPPTAERRPRRRLVWMLVLALLVAAGVVWWTRHGSAPQPARTGRSGAPMSIVPETVGKGDIGINVNALGTVTSLATVTIKSQISGYLMKIDFKEGDDVKRAI